MNLRSVSEVLEKTRIILRLDTDLPINDFQILDNSRLLKSISTINTLLQKKCKIAVIGHLGRPDGTNNSTLSLKPVYLELISLLQSQNLVLNSIFIEDFDDKEKIDLSYARNDLIFFENLRFYPGENAGDTTFLNNLLEVSQFFVNDAFAVSHRPHASVILHRLLPAFYGHNFVSEFEVLQKIDSCQKPMTLILGGAKEDKLIYLPKLINHFDHILIGGRLPLLASSPSDPKIIVASLTPDTLDISPASIAQFKEIINQSKTVIWVGAMGNFEKHYQIGTNEIATTLANSSAYKVIAGGDTSVSIKNLDIQGKIDYICSGGGVLLEYLATHTLPAIN